MDALKNSSVSALRLRFAKVIQIFGYVTAVGREDENSFIQSLSTLKPERIREVC